MITLFVVMKIVVPKSSEECAGSALTVKLTCAPFAS